MMWLCDRVINSICCKRLSRGTFSSISFFSQYFIITDNSLFKNWVEVSIGNTACIVTQNVLCFHARKHFVRVGVILEGRASYFDISKLMWRTVRSDKGILSLFMPPCRHFNLEMLNILISLFFIKQTTDLTLTSCSFFPSTEDGYTSQRTEPDEEEQRSLQGCIRHQQVLHQEMK